MIIQLELEDSPAERDGIIAQIEEQIAAELRRRLANARAASAEAPALVQVQSQLGSPPRDHDAEMATALGGLLTTTDARGTGEALPDARVPDVRAPDAGMMGLAETRLHAARQMSRLTEEQSGETRMSGISLASDSDRQNELARSAWVDHYLSSRMYAEARELGWEGAEDSETDSNWGRRVHPASEGGGGDGGAHHNVPPDRLADFSDSDDIFEQRQQPGTTGPRDHDARSGRASTAPDFDPFDAQDSDDSDDLFSNPDLRV